MNEMYWITRLDILCDSLECASILSIIGIIFLGIGYVVFTLGNDDVPKLITKYLRISLLTFFPCIVLRMFVPTSKEAVMIWGIGSTLDYLKSNDTSKQLPDKCIDALDAWVDSLNEEKKEE